MYYMPLHAWQDANAGKHTRLRLGGPGSDLDFRTYQAPAIILTSHAAAQHQNVMARAAPGPPATSRPGQPASAAAAAGRQPPLGPGQSLRPGARTGSWAGDSEVEEDGPQAMLGPGEPEAHIMIRLLLISSR